MPIALSGVLIFFFVIQNFVARSTESENPLSSILLFHHAINKIHQPNETIYLFLLCLFVRGILYEQQPVEKYPFDSASVEHAGVPKGEVLKFTFDQSKIFPGTWREYWVYVPVQYKPDKPACVYVNEDGIQWKAPTVFDNLIHNKEMPITIGVFVTPGRVMADSASNALTLAAVPSVN